MENQNFVDINYLAFPPTYSTVRVINISRIEVVGRIMVCLTHETSALVCLTH